MEDFKAMLFETISSFKNQKNQPIDWTIAWEDDSKFETILDAVDALIDGIALIPDIEEPKRINMLGRLALNRSHLAYSYGNDQQIAHFIKHGQNLEHLLKEVLNLSPWIKAAEARFDEYVDFEETVSEESDINQKQIDYFRPILMALAAMAIITIEQEEESEEDEAKDDFSFEDEEECDEYCDE
jgi:hypothetical protein